MLVLGCVLVLDRGISDASELPASVAAAGVASALALLAVTVDEADEAFANIYSAAVSVQNLAPGAAQRLLVGLVAVLATVGALAIELANYETFLFLLGSFFVPLFGVLLADWLLSGASYANVDFFRAPPLRVGPRRRLARRLRLLPVAAPARPVMVGRVRRADGDAGDADRVVAAELRALLRARGARDRPRAPDQAPGVGDRVIAAAQCEDALYLVEVGATAEEDELAGREPGATVERPRPADLTPPWASAQLVDIDAAGSTIVLLLDRRPPLLVSHDAGGTWADRGAGLPPGRAVALGSNPDDILFAARNRLHVSRNGGIFWRVLGVELPEIRDVAWGLTDLGSR